MVKQTKCRSKRHKSLIYGFPPTIIDRDISLERKRQRGDVWEYCLKNEQFRKIASKKRELCQKIVVVNSVIEDIKTNGVWTKLSFKRFFYCGFRSVILTLPFHSKLLRGERERQKCNKVEINSTPSHWISTTYGWA